VNEWTEYTEQIKDVVDMRALIEGTTGPLKGGGRGGRPSLALCPWHSDQKTPSLAVYDDHAHCFGCGWHGDCFEWVMRRDGLDFVDARDMLARQESIPRPTRSPEAQAHYQARRQYEDGLAVAAEFFRAELWKPDGTVGLVYAKERGWSKETIQAERLGYAAPGCRDRLTQALKASEVGSQGRAAAVAKKIAGFGWYKGGAIVYIHRWRGRVVYLSARAIRPEVIKHEAHYNPPERWIDDAGNDKGLLAGARRPYVNHLYSARSTSVVVVEGQGCAISLVEWGQVGWSLNGSALDREMGQTLQRHKSIYVGMDRDATGEEMLPKVAEIAGPTAQVVNWAPVKDANDLLVLLRGLSGWGQPLDAKQVSEQMRRYVERRLIVSPSWLQVRLKRFKDIEGTERDEEMECIVELYVGLGSFIQARVQDDVLEGLDIGKRELGRLMKAVLEQRMMEQPYDARQGALCRLDGVNDQGQPNWVPLCNFSALIEEQITRDDGQRRNLELQIVGRSQDGRGFPAINIEAKEFGSMNWILEYWGVDAILNVGFSTKEHLRKAIQVLSRESLKRRNVYAHLGWRTVNGKRAFLYQGGAVGAENVEVYLDDTQLKYYRLPSQPVDLPEAMAASLRFLELAPPQISVPLWAAMFVAPLTKIITPDYMLWVYGKTGTMKSTIAALALNHYGPEWAYNRMPAGWQDTPAKIEMRAFLAKDVPLILDDFARDVYSQRGLDKKAQDLIRRLVNRQGRGRMTSQLTSRMDFPPRGLVMSTAEQLPQGQSVIGRLMGVEIQPDDIQKEAMTEGQEARGRYSHAMAGYLLWLAEQWDGLGKTLPDQWAELRDQALKESGHLRIPSAIASLYVGFDVGLAFFTERGAIAQSDADQWRKVGWDALISLALEQKRLVQDEDPVERFVRIFQILLAQEKIYLKGISGIEDTKHDWQAEQLGFVGDKGWVYLFGEATLSYIARFCQQMGEPYPLNRNAFYKALVEADVATPSTSESGGNVHQLRVGDENHKVLKVRTDALGVVIRYAPEPLPINL
jgi:hypothetical protein